MEKIVSRMCDPKKIGLPIKGGRFNQLVRQSARFLVEKEPDTGAHQVLPQIATLVRVDLGTCVVEVVVFDKRAPLRIEKVICAGDHVPRQVSVICSASSVDGGCAGHGVLDLDPRRFGVVNADPCAGIRLELPSWGPKSKNDVKHKGAAIDPSGHVALVS